MSRELSLELLSDNGVQQIVAQRQKTLVWVATKVVDYATSFEEVIKGVDSEEVRKVARAGLPAAFVQNVNKSFSGTEVAERLIADARELIGTVDIAEQAYAEENADEEEKLAAEKKAAEAAENERLQKEADAKRVADAQRLEAKQLQDANNKAEAERVAQEQREATERAAANKAAAKAEAAEADAKNAESNTSNVEDDGRLTQAGLDSMPIKASGLPSGIISDLLAGRIETVGNLILLAEHEDGDLSVIKGIGPESSKKIMARIIELKSQVAASESE